MDDTKLEKIDEFEATIVLFVRHKAREDIMGDTKLEKTLCAAQS